MRPTSLPVSSCLYQYSRGCNSRDKQIIISFQPRKENKMFNEDDMILPEGFNPELGDQNFTENGELVDVAAPTTDANTSNSNVPETTTESTPAQDPTTSPEATVQETPEAPVAPAEVPDPQIPRTLKVRFNHEDRELSLDEAAVLAQKGLNFDKIEQKSKDNEARLNRFEEMAKMFGFDNAEAMMTQAEENYVETKVKDLVDAGNTEAMARFLVKQEMQNVKRTQPTVSQPTAAKTSLNPNLKAELDEFIAAYPGVTKIPDDVFKMHKEGLPLKAAYAIFEKQQALADANNKMKAVQDELSILKQNQAAAAKGPVTGTVGKTAPEKEVPEDPFLKGFESGL